MSRGRNRSHPCGRSDSRRVLCDSTRICRGRRLGRSVEFIVRRGTSGRIALGESVRRTIAMALLLGALSCHATDPSSDLTGKVSNIYVNPPDVWYPGEIRVDGTQVGTIRVFIFYDMPIHIRSSGKTGNISSFAVGDRLIMQTCDSCAILKSAPPVWPVTEIEIDK